MIKMLGFIGATVGGAVGWWLGDKVGGMMTAFVVSMIGTAAGVYYGRRIGTELQP